MNSVDVVVDDDDVVEDSSSDKDYEFEAKKRKYDFNFVNNKSSDDLLPLIHLFQESKSHDHFIIC